jgi:hypothetical protein
MCIKTIAVVILITILISCQTQTVRNDSPFVEYLNPDEKSDMPFSEAVRVGAMLYLSG